ncbi:MAG: HAD-IA family hydrolase [Chloroflexi bacterium]|nr:HAD-IA family hydrolase [Chloroflexota bacterium]
MMQTLFIFLSIHPYYIRIKLVTSSVRDFCSCVSKLCYLITVSDAWSDARQNLKQFVNSDLFDVIVFSAEEGVRKPDPEIYHRTLARLGMVAREVIFVDDRLSNTVGAQQIGMHAIHFSKTNRTIEEILRLLQT